MSRRNEKFPDNGFEAWGGYMQAKIAKLEKQFDARADKEKPLTNIFNGISIYVNGFTDPSAEELNALMSKHGGVYHTYQRSEDFIIASNLPDTKVKNMSLARVVKPEWITESIAANRLQDFRDFLLYKNSKTQKQLNFSRVVKKYQTKTSLCEIIEDTSERASQAICNVKAKDTNITKFLQESATPISIETTKLSPCIQNSAKTAADPNFISEFYNNSRLHHISQLGAFFKQHVNNLRENSSFSYPARKQLKEAINSHPNATNNAFSQIKFEKGKVIMHIDMDCFFVSVGLRNRPELCGKSVAVTHSKGGQPRSKRPGVDRSTEFNLYRQKQAQKLGIATEKDEREIEFESRVDNITDEHEKYGSMSEIASCSYEARAKGLVNGMFMGAALKLCPDLQTIPYDFDGYKEVAFSLYNTIAQYTLDIEAVSCDEMYADCTDLLKDLDVSVQDFALALRNEIKSKTGCPCSTGFGGNRLQARLATKRAKPDGQFFLSEDLVEDFMYDINLRDLPGVGRQTSQKLESLGHTTCGSLQQLSLASLKCHLGVKTGILLFNQCRGRDPNPLTFQTIRKSVSAEVNYGIRFENIDQCYDFLKQLSEEVHSRMLQFKVIGKCITLKLMVRAEEAPVETAKFMGHGFCNIINKSHTLVNATNDAEIITKAAVFICKKLNIDPKDMRGIGIQITKLESTITKPITGAISKFLCAISDPIKNKIDLQPSTLLVENELAVTKMVLQKQWQSPKKQIPYSSPKKSSILQIRSPVKRRGRPSKIAKLQLTSSKKILSKFLHGHSSRDTHYRDPMVKIEVINTQDRKPVINNEQVIIQNLPVQQSLIGLPWKEVRELLRAWLDSGQAPLPCDINLISAYMREMVIDKNLEKLNILLNFLKRRTLEINSKEWNEVCMHVLEQVQNAMLAVYGKRLHM